MGDGAPSTPQHPAAPEDIANEAPPRVTIPRRSGAGKNTIRDRGEREDEQEDGDPQAGDADGVGVEPAAAYRVERVEEDRLVLHLLIAVPAEQPGDPRGDAVEQLRPREDHVADFAEEVLTRHGDRAPQIARGPVDDREPSQDGIRHGIDGHAPPGEQPVERGVHAGMGGLLAQEGLDLGALCLRGNARQ